MAPDLPDYTRDMHITLSGELLSQTRSLPWWVRYTPARLVFLDDFEGVLKWTQLFGTITKASGLDTFEATNHLSMVTLASGGLDAHANLLLGALPRSKMACQLRWHPYESADNVLSNFSVSLTLTDGSYSTQFIIEYLKNWVTAQNKWRYLNENEVMSDIPGGSETIDTTLREHQTLYFTVDFRTSVLRYARLVSGRLDLDLSSLRPYHVASAVAPGLSVDLRAVANITASAHVYVDAFCLSDQEL